VPERIIRFAPWLAGLLVVCAYVLIDRHGPAATHDSLYYLQGASYWLQTGTFSNNYWGTVQPEVHYAPLFSGVLALLAGVSGSTPLAVAHWLMPLLAGLNLALFGGILHFWRWSKLHIAGMLLIIGTAFPFFSMHWHIWSEPMYLSCILAAALLLLQWQKSGQTALLLLAASMAGFSVLVRYAGLFMLPLFVLAIYQARKSHLWRNIFVFSAVSLLPFALWTIRNKLLAQSLSSRSLFWDWAGVHEFLRAVETLISWGNLALLGLAVLFICFRRKRNLLPDSWIWLAGGSLYVILIFLAKSAVDKQIPIDARLLSPLLLPILLIFGREMMLWSAKQRTVWIAIALVGGLVQGASFAAGAYRDGWAFNDRRLLEEGTPLRQMQAVLPQEAPVFATDVDAHYLAYLLEREVNYLSRGEALPTGAYFLRWKAPLPETSTIEGSDILLDGLVWHRRKAP